MLNPFDIQEYVPRQELKPFVSRWVNLEYNQKDEYVHKIAPSGRIILVHTYGSFVYAYPPNGDTITYRNATYFKGHRLKEPLNVKNCIGVKEFACEFTYTGFYRLFHIAANKLVDIEYEISDFGFQDFNDALFSTTDLTEKRKIASDYFLSLIPKAKSLDPEVEELIAAIEQGDYSELSKLKSYSASAKKKIYRKFKKQTGLAITQFKRIHQMNTAIRLMNEKDYESLSQLACKAGYYDQADLVKHLKHFLRTTPTDLLKNSEQDLLFQYMGGPKDF